jgi:hypothetical protein
MSNVNQGTHSSVRRTPQKQTRTGNPEAPKTKQGDLNISLLGKREDMNKSCQKDLFKMLSYASGSPDPGHGFNESVKRKDSGKFRSLDFRKTSNLFSGSRSMKKINPGSIKDIGSVDHDHQINKFNRFSFNQVNSLDNKKKFMLNSDEIESQKFLHKADLNLHDLNFNLNKLKDDGPPNLKNLESLRNPNPGLAIFPKVQMHRIKELDESNFTRKKSDYCFKDTPPPNKNPDQDSS